jgi:DNA-binding XRE family transcriptional regulator
MKRTILAESSDAIWLMLASPSTTYTHMPFDLFVDRTARHLAATSLLLLGLACSSSNAEPVAPWLEQFPIVSTVRTPEITVRRQRAPVVAPDTAEKLAVIQTRFGLNKTQLAQVCQVQRQTIYDWYAGRFDAEGKNAQRVEDLYSLARDSANMLNAVSPKLCDKPLESGKSLFALLSARTLREAVIKSALSELRVVADRRKPTLAERRAALGFRERSVDERRALLASTLDDVSKS